jgi:hypothetical protein
MVSFLFKFTLVSNSALPFCRLLVSEFLLGISENFHCSMSAPASAANVVCRDADVFGSRNILLRHFL